MRRLDRSTWLPLAAFGLALAVSLWISADAGSTPEARLHARVRAYLDALRSGDPAAAAPYRLDADPRREARRAEGLKARAYVLQGVEVAADEREARVTVMWLADPRHGVRERQIWTREPAGDWLFRALEGVPERVGP